MCESTSPICSDTLVVSLLLTYMLIFGLTWVLVWHHLCWSPGGLSLHKFSYGYWSLVGPPARLSSPGCRWCWCPCGLPVPRVLATLLLSDAPGQWLHRLATYCALFGALDDAFCSTLNGALYGALYGAICSPLYGALCDS